MFNRNDTDPLFQFMFEATVVGLIFLGLIGVGWAIVESVDAVHGQEWACVQATLNECLSTGQNEDVCHDAAREICK